MRFGFLVVTEPSRDGGRDGTSDIEEGKQPVQAVGGAEARGGGAVSFFTRLIKLIHM